MNDNEAGEMPAYNTLPDDHPLFTQPGMQGMRCIPSINLGVQGLLIFKDSVPIEERERVTQGMVEVLTEHVTFLQNAFNVVMQCPFAGRAIADKLSELNVNPSRDVLTALNDTEVPTERFNN